VRGILVEVPDPKALKSLLDRGEQDREIGPAPNREIRDGEWVTVTVRVGMRDTRVPARARDLGDGPSLVLSERDWQRLRSFARCCSDDGRISHPPSGVTAILRGKVYVLTDVPCLGEVISATLASIGVEAVVWSSADEMVERMVQFPSDVVVVDAQIPDASCSSLCRQLHELAPERRPAILLLVASSSPSGDISAMTFGADDFLLTPFRRQELLARITSLLHRAATEKGIIGAA
jgi:CheY-like chemotaxis protein